MTDKAILETMEQLKRYDSPQVEDEISLFCASLAIKMRRLSPYQRGMAQLRVLQVIQEAEWSNQSPTAFNPQQSGNYTVVQPTYSYYQQPQSSPGTFDQGQFNYYSQQPKQVQQPNQIQQPSKVHAQQHSKIQEPSQQEQPDGEESNVGCSYIALL